MSSVPRATMAAAKFAKLAILYVPCSSQQEAERIASQLLFEKLIVCANIYHSVSMYLWKKSLTKTNEKVLFAKTITDKVSKAQRRIQQLHSYECPAILVLPVTGVNASYLQWCIGELSSKEQKNRKTNDRRNLSSQRRRLQR